MCQAWSQGPGRGRRAPGHGSPSRQSQAHPVMAPGPTPTQQDSKADPAEQVLSVVLRTPGGVGQAGAGSCRPGVVSCLLVLDTSVLLEPRGQEARDTDLCWLIGAVKAAPEAVPSNQAVCAILWHEGIC